ncbi:unnamed protein product [Parnassius apollo]|uniref:(apollo) hypothetical protein n=1 Tax=Parnassius apollo TaxID=110799 RepID=A0A8S3Y428_PARAO|nr:unnamed protein product [Parnassius apollo]
MEGSNSKIKSDHLEDVPSKKFKFSDDELPQKRTVATMCGAWRPEEEDGGFILVFKTRKPCLSPDPERECDYPENIEDFWEATFQSDVDNQLTMDKWLIKRTSTDAGSGSPNKASQIKRIKHVVLDSSVASDSTMTTTVTSNISRETNATTSSTSSVITIDESRETSSSTTITISHKSDDCSSTATSTLHIYTESDASTSTKQATATSETSGKRQRIFKESYIQFGFKCTVLNFE